MTTYIQISKQLDEALGIRTMSFEYEIISCFFDREKLSPKELIAHSSASGTTFFSYLIKLERDGILVAEPHPDDSRSKLYRLSEKATSAIRNQWERSASSKLEELEETGNARLALQKFGHGLRRDLKIRHLNCDFQILLYLFIEDGMTNLQCGELIDVSETKFNKSLRALRSKGLLYSIRNCEDGRSKVYFLGKEARVAIGRTRDQVVQWTENLARNASEKDGYETKILGGA